VDVLHTMAPLTLAINFVLDTEILVEKALARRMCENCGTGYNLANIVRDGYDMLPLLPKVPHTCDECAGKRADDTEPIIRDRLAIYEKETFPIIDYYRKKGIFMEFKVKKGVADMPQLVKEIEDALKVQQQKK
jgi:adenylate kinase